MTPLLNIDWYDVITGPDIEQGDIIVNCPVFMIEDTELPENFSDTDGKDIPTRLIVYDVIIMTQSCDLEVRQGRQNVQNVVLCPIEGRTKIEKNKNHPLFNKGVLRKAAKGEHPAFFVIPEYIDENIQGQSREVGVVHFQQVYTLPADFLRSYAEGKGPRLRLKSPYREALSSRFAAFFGRIALKNPVQI